jgi:hypothetical protein
VKKNWPIDHLIGCKPFSSLVKLIEIEAKFFKRNLNELIEIVQKDEILKYRLL